VKEIVQSSTEKSGIVVDNNLHSDLLNIMQSNDKSIENTYPAGTFLEGAAQVCYDYRCRPSNNDKVVFKF
jgi:hypothetical protein